MSHVVSQVLNQPVVHGLDVVLEVGVALEEPVRPADPAVEGQVVRGGVLDAILPLHVPGKREMINIPIDNQRKSIDLD